MPDPFPPANFIQVASKLEGIEVFAPAPEAIAPQQPVVEFKCPQCGATTAYSVEDGGLTCTHCGYHEPAKKEVVGTGAQEFEFALGAAEDTAQRLALTRRVARLYEEQLEDLDAAFEWYGKVFREDPSDRHIRDQLQRLAGILDRWGDLAQVLQSYLDDSLQDDAATLEVSRVLAAIYDDRLADVGRARICYQRILGATPEDTSAFEDLEACVLRRRAIVVVDA